MKHGWFIGECMLELRPASASTLAQAFAGDVYNTAVYFHRLAPSYPCAFVSCIGTDLLSNALLEDTAGHGLDVTRVMRIPDRQPGLYWINTDASGERTFLYWRSQSAAREMLDAAHSSALLRDAAVCGLLYFSGITLAILDKDRRQRLLQLAEVVRGAGGMVAFDSNYRASLWEDRDTALQWTLAAARLASHLLVTDDDEAALNGDSDARHTLARSLALGPGEVVVKMGAQGCLVQSKAMSAPVPVAAAKASVVDTTAAGDSFNGAYLAERIGGAGPVEAAYAAGLLAARVVGFAGAIIDAGNMP
ncbi:sugar kinase [Noviherbaspirillum aerium]|uniref:sugar kinase n=1 Tax=Noviherbaspirillum aerium TaxID=2588497 RepID=UPI00124E63C8|nr:sugar kinase [Noviherbaspirillum aerium]